VDADTAGLSVPEAIRVVAPHVIGTVAFDDCRVPAGQMLGKPGDGWRVSLTTLMNERVSIGGTMPAKGSGTIQALTATWADLPEDRKAPATRDAVMKLWSRAEVLRLTNIRANQNRKMGDPGPEGSIGKMAGADLNKDIYEMVIDLMGADRMLYGSYEMVRPEPRWPSSTCRRRSCAAGPTRSKVAPPVMKHPRRARPRPSRRRPRRPRSSMEPSST
jgi:alkylation response protein AidB-like acyl-CoA dehydrogenase